MNPKGVDSQQNQSKIEHLNEWIKDCELSQWIWKMALGYFIPSE